MNYGYARISTTAQNLDLQINALRAAGCDKIFTDEISGNSRDRTGLGLIMAGIRDGDVVTVWKLDRLSRTVAGLIDTVQTIEKSGAQLRSLTEKIDTSSTAGKFFFHTMAALAEMERELIIERTKAGLDAAKKRGIVPGRRRTMTDSKIISASRLYAAGTPVKNIAQDLGVSVPTLYRFLKTRKVIVE